MSALSLFAGAATETIRVLHVDDEPDFADLVASFLEREDDRFSVDTATSASEGLDRLDGDGYDCVIADYKMPHQNGIEFLEAVRERFPDLPFILFTGKGSESIAGDAISAGVTDYLQKEGGTEQYTVLANRVTNAAEHYRSQEVVRRSEQRLREIIDALPHPLYVIDESGTYQMANGALAAFYDTTVATVEGEHISDVLGEKPATQFYDEITGVIASGAPKRLPEVERIDPTGESHVFDVRLLPYDLGGDDGAVLGLAVDITERQARERQLTALLTYTNNAMYIKDREGVYQLANDAFAEMAGMERSELVGSRVTDIFDEEGAKRSLATDQRVMETGESVTEEVVRSIDGRERVFITEKFPYHDTDGSIIGVMGLSIDITEQKAYERQLERQNARLDEFDSIVSHDLQTPLEDAHDYLDVVHDECTSDHTEALSDALERLQTVVDDLHDLAQADTR